MIVLPIADKRPYLARYAEPDKIAFGMDHEDAWPVKFWEIDEAMASMVALLATVDESLGGRSRTRSTATAGEGRATLER